MTTRPLLLATVCAFAALASACDGDRSVRISSTSTDDGDAKGVLKVVDTLQCPQTMGSLTRKGSGSNRGAVCTYVGPKGAEVSLHLVSLDGEEPGQLLKAFEDRLASDMPAAVAQLKAAADAEKARAARADAEAARADAAAARADAEQARAGAAQARAEGDRASVSGPGVQIEANGDDASVHLPGIHIDARGDNASVSIGGFHIDAHDSDGPNGGDARVRGTVNGDQVNIQAHEGTAEVRTRAGGDATRASWILTDNQASPAGWRLVGYEARGPAGGPIVVATIRTKEGRRGRVFEDARDLVALNVGE